MFYIGSFFMPNFSILGYAFKKIRGYYMYLKNIFSVSLLTLLSMSCAHAATIEEISASGTALEKGEKIADEIEARDTGFKNVSSTMKMILKTKEGQSITREMRLKIFEIDEEGAGDYSLITFDNPRDVAGTSLLSYAKILDADKQWLYLPALKRVKRISSRNKSGPFVGSEFAYEDITANEVKKYSWELLGVGPCPNDEALECAKLNSVPKYENSGYTKRIVYVDTQEFRPMKTEYYDRKHTHLKTQTYSDYKQYKDKFWRADKWEIVNHQSGKSTSLHFDNYDFDTVLKKRDFNQSALKRAL